MTPIMTEPDWLSRTPSSNCGLAEPPEPISGPIEHYDPDELLRDYRDEHHWSATIRAKQSVHPDIPAPYEDEEE
jgi:hypothetical protein